MPMRVIRRSDPQREEEDDTFTINVSSGGLLFNSQLDLQEGDKIDLQIMPMNIPIVEYGLVIRASATVVRSQKELFSHPWRSVAARFDSSPRIEKL